MSFPDQMDGMKTDITHTEAAVGSDKAYLGMKTGNRKS